MRAAVSPGGLGVARSAMLRVGEVDEKFRFAPGVDLPVFVGSRTHANDFWYGGSVSRLDQTREKNIHSDLMQGMWQIKQQWKCGGFCNV